jgi:hypothetical protein
MRFVQREQDDRELLMCLACGFTQYHDLDGGDQDQD